jgi:lysophospholipid acyltransferase (LPLAT)-like uncharacterized protein
VSGDGPPPSRGLIDAPWFRGIAAWLIASYLRLVRATNKPIRIPEDRAVRLEEFGKLRPAIMVSWHANILALALFLEDGMGEFVALASPHVDGQLGASIIRSFGYPVIFGTGVSDRQSAGTGGISAMREMLRELEAGRSVYLSAEIPPMPGRRVSPGVIALARMSGRPIVAIAAATTRRTIVERLWDKMQINHPFGTAVLIADGPLFIDESITNEEGRARLKTLLDNAYAQALHRADEIARR